MKAERKNVESDLAVDVFFSNLVAGRDGLVPEIGQDGRWWIGGRDTGVVARGLTPEIGANGNWWIGGVDTGKPSRYEIPATEKMPKGAIILWRGTEDSLPLGWALCDGKNETPDLRGRFVVGYASGDADYGTIDNIGGVPAVILAESQMPSHTHTVCKTADNHEFDQVNTFGVVATNLEDVTKVDIGLNKTGGSEAHENRPPYYVLAYIIKL